MKACGVPQSLHEIQDDVRTLKAVVTFVIYGMLFLLVKTLYESGIDLPRAATSLLLVGLSFLLVMIVLLFNRFSRKAIERITSFAEAAQEASRAKSAFLATMSHELRTPLNAVIGFSQVLRQGQAGPISDMQRDFCDEIHAAGAHLLALINDILDLSKIEAGKMTLELERVDLAPLVQGSLTVVREKAHHHGIILEARVGDDLGEVRVDCRKVKQILFNLLSNAVKFTPDGGRVLLEARRLADDLFELSVSDTGIGIAARDLPRLFRPFEQLESSAGRRYEGTGLGLSVVKRLAELHGGAVSVNSQPGKGSRFSVRLPLAAAATA